MFRFIVIACLAMIAYGVTYRNLPCWAQLFDKTFYCQVADYGQKVLRGPRR